MTRILIADDHDVVRSGVRAILEAQTGWEVVGEAENGKDAVDQALATRPDVVVLDYALPVLNGIEATHQIRARVPGAEVLIFTMHETLLETYLAKGAATQSVLTSREKSVMQLIAEGRTNKEMAAVLGIGLKTVETHRASAMRKLNLDTTAALIRYAIRNKLVES